MDRKIIFKCRTGSHLYGTNRPESDDDFQGVFLPSAEDMLSMHKCPGELTEDVKLSTGAKNEAGDIDCKYYSLQKFFKLAAEGQPGQLEMLFAPADMILTSSSEWLTIQENLHLFLSKKGISPFIGFALSQAHRAVVKGENLNLIREIIKWGDELDDAERRSPLGENFTLNDKKDIAYLQPKGSVQEGLIMAAVKYYINDHGFPQVRVAGRDWDQNVQTKAFIAGMKKLEGKYGSRVENAAAQGYDYKSLGHAVRLLGQAEEYLTTGVITLPRPDADYLKTILRGTIDDKDIDWFDLLNKKIDHIKMNLVDKSTLPENANHKQINKLCVKMLTEHLAQQINRRG